MLDDALTARIATAKKRLLDGGLLQLVSNGVSIVPQDGTGPPRATKSTSIRRLTRS